MHCLLNSTDYSIKMIHLYYWSNINQACIFIYVHHLNIVNLLSFASYCQVLITTLVATGFDNSMIEVSHHLVFTSYQDKTSQTLPQFFSLRFDLIQTFSLPPFFLLPAFQCQNIDCCFGQSCNCQNFRFICCFQIMVTLLIIHIRILVNPNLNGLIVPTLAPFVISILR